MPLVRISMIRSKPREYIRAISEGVHRALVETFDVPLHDKFQLIQEHDRDRFVYDAEYLGIHRSDDVVFINIIASVGRSLDQKKALYRRIADHLERDPGLRPADIIIVMSPNERMDWSFGNGLASYVRDEGGT